MMWEKLNSIYQSKGPQRKSTLLKKLTLMKQEEGDVRDHLNNFFDVIDKLEEMEIKVNKELSIIMLLQSLPRSYAVFRCTMESRGELPEPEDLRAKIMFYNDGKKCESQNGIQDDMLSKKKFYEKNKNSGEKKMFPYKCHRCHKKGHMAVNCPEKAKDSDKAYNVETESF
uniref:CCHC-type domain-containing protein n=1 Tax=Bracon brevicornis TaxID=1563983 RepID=A0A6V7JSK6_9HYME